MKVIQAFGDIQITLVTELLVLPDNTTEKEILAICRRALNAQLDKISCIDTDSRGFSNITYTIDGVLK